MIAFHVDRGGREAEGGDVGEMVVDGGDEQASFDDPQSRKHGGRPEGVKNSQVRGRAWISAQRRERERGKERLCEKR